MTDSVATGQRIARRLAVALIALAPLCACAPGPSPETAQASAAPIRQDAQGTPICRPDPALLVPQSTPDCSFGRLALKTLDAERWARLKMEYERQCYQRAERTVRERLRLLQEAARCPAASSSPLTIGGGLPA